VRTHNDRGTAVASAELAAMAGAQRVEGALFGNGERSGNMDIIIMALNLFSQGIYPELDFSDINKIADVCKKCTRMDIHPRHPYAGELVYTAFSGSHQDAINKRMKPQRERKNDTWDVPYLPICPKDVGRSYEAVTRINSQSGKGGIAYVMENDWGFKIPKEMQPDLAKMIRALTENAGNELSSQEIKGCFEREYINKQGQFKLKHCTVHSEDANAKKTAITALIEYNQQEVEISGRGIGPADAVICGVKKKFNLSFDTACYWEHSLAQGADAEAVAYIGIKTKRGRMVFGVGIDAAISRASIKAVFSALNRLSAFLRK